jgi:predicted dehydrogenase
MADNDRSRPLRIGVIGVGFISQVAHLPCYAADSGARICAISDTRPDVLDAVGRRFSIPKTYRHHTELINDSELDAVVVCIHRKCLGPVTEEVLASGKATFCEKPMAHSRAQAERLLHAVKLHNQIYAIGYMRRHDAGARLFRSLLLRDQTKEELGEIIHIAVRDFNPVYAVPVPQHIRSNGEMSYRYDEWPCQPEGMPSEMSEDYQYTLNVISHDLNLVRWLLGNDLLPQCLSVKAGLAQTATLTARSCDLIIQAGRSSIGVWDQSVEIFFRRGRMLLRLASPLARQEVAHTEIHRSSGCEIVHVPPADRIWAFRAQAAHFVSATRGEVPLETSGHDGINDTALIEELWKNVAWRQ